MHWKCGRHTADCRSPEGMLIPSFSGTLVLDSYTVKLEFQAKTPLVLDTTRSNILGGSAQSSEVQCGCSSLDSLASMASAKYF